ncbi:uncharacterized protein LOC106163571 [Lingula anatina]|uniref:Uncharacterized protein LOC106163571 n=1 Tax=Lingula anatina TaxID=7574 RepID=A0A1S3IEJ8_LINAN|nr:uncharacterized protein LOC106163571 [Lingula anatina]|eukprot:XP_013396657.1 uncharacterized protein LOC106163571 [Lingula anatina]
MLAFGRACIGATSTVITEKNNKKMQQILTISYVLTFLNVVGIVLGIPDEKNEKPQATILRQYTYLVRWKLGDLEQYKDCELSYGADLSNNLTVVQYIVPASIVQGYELNNLSAHAKYTVRIVCYRNNGLSPINSTVDFITNGSLEDVTTQQTGVNTETKRSIISTVTSTEYPSVLKEKISYGMLNKVDITLGVIFGIVGITIVAGGTFYIWRKVRRYNRIQRFVGYVST